MSNLHIVGFAGLGGGLQGGNDQIIAPPDTTEVQSIAIAVAPGNTSAQFNPKTRVLKVTAGAACAIALGANPQAAVGGWFLNAGETIWISVPLGTNYKINAVTDTL